MEEFRESGIFWLPNMSDPVAGELVFNLAEGVQLSLIGQFDDWYTKSHDEPSLITGVAGKHDVTLLGVQKTNSTMSSSGVALQKFRADELLVGHCFETESEVLFTSALVRYYDLGGWIKNPHAEANFRTSEAERSDIVNFTYERPESMDFDMGKAVVSVVFGWSSNSYDEEWRFTHYPSFRLRYRSPVGRQEILKHVSYIQSFITLCTDVSIATRAITLYAEDVPLQMLDGSVSERPQPVEYRSQAITTPSVMAKSKARGIGAELDFHAVGGIRAVGSWMKVADQYGPVINLLMSVRSGMGMYVENRFLNIVNAAEAFHRLRHGGTQIPHDEYQHLVEGLLSATPRQHYKWLTGKLKYLNEPTLQKRLRQLAVEAQSITGVITGKAGVWADYIAKARNALTHTSKDGAKGLSGAVLHWFGESVYFVLRINLLNECLEDIDSLARLSGSDALTFIAARVQQSLVEASETLNDRLSTSTEGDSDVALQGEGVDEP